MNNTKSILGILGLGIAIGMLLASEKGSGLRKALMGSIEDLGGQLGDIVSEAKDKMLGLESNVESAGHEAKGEIVHSKG